MSAPSLPQPITIPALPLLSHLTSLSAGCQDDPERGSTTSLLRPGGHQHRGAWSRTMAPQISVLDTGYSRRRERSRERSLRLESRSRGSGRVESYRSSRGERDAEDCGGRECTVGKTRRRDSDGEASQSPYYVDTEFHPGMKSCCKHDDRSRHRYDIWQSGILGVACGPDPRTLSSEVAPRCFNCGDPNHMVSCCPARRNNALIALSRQMYEIFSTAEPIGMGLRGFAEREDFRAKRLRWLHDFQPGEIRDPVLRDALGITGKDSGTYVQWLPRMARWGYPPGWVGSEDPRLQVRDIVINGRNREQENDETEFRIYGDSMEPEVVLLPGGTYNVSSRSTSQDHPMNSELSSITLSDIDDVSRRPLGSPRSRRWATYPSSYFRSTRLPVYDGRSLPSDAPASYGYNVRAQSGTSRSSAPPWSSTTRRRDSRSRSPPPKAPRQPRAFLRTGSPPRGPRAMICSHVSGPRISRSTSIKSSSDGSGSDMDISD